MNQYRCETCKNLNCPVWIGANLRLAQTGKMSDHHLITVIERIGCTHHSNFQNQREKVLDEVVAFLRKKEKLDPATAIFYGDARNEIDTELRQEGKDGE